MKVIPGSLAVAISSLLLFASCSGEAAAEGRTPDSEHSWSDAGVEALEEAALGKDVPYVPTPHATVEEMLRMADVGEDDLLYDLGSGDGRIVVAAARRGARGVGIDIDPKRIEEANENAARAGVSDRVKFVRADLFHTDFHEATAVTLYLLPSVNLRLRPRLLEQLKPGTPVVSHDFTMQEWEPDDQSVVEGRHVYLWIVPAQVGDRHWTWTGADGMARTATFDQKFQRISGAVTVGGATFPVGEATLRGDQIAFSVNRGGTVERYHGRVDGGSIRGTAEIGGARTPWRAGD